MSTLAEISQKIIDAIEQLLTLEVRTVINDAEHGNRTLLTQINLASGDIETRMHVDFVTGALEEVRAYHAEQVLKGQNIIGEHIKTLAALVDDLKAQRQPGTALNGPQRTAQVR
jgi:hypothetical protein